MTSKLKPPYRAIAQRLMEGQVIPFLGAGASIGERIPTATKWESPTNSFLPTGSELADYIARDVEFPNNEHRDLAKVAQYAQIVVGRAPLEDTLRRIFKDSGTPFRAHKLFASISKPMLMISTNYDDLLEQALAGTKFDLVIHSNSGDVLWRRHGEKESTKVSPKKLDIDLEKTTVIYKMHGSVGVGGAMGDQFVVTEDDYIEFLTRMSRRDAIPHIFTESFSKCAFLFLGYGLNDWNLRVVLNRIERDLGKRKNITSWAIQFPLSPLERRFWQDRDVEVYEDTIEHFISELENHMR